MIRSASGRRLIVAGYVLLTFAVVLAFDANVNLQWPFLVWISVSVIGTWVLDRGWFALMPLLAIPIALPLGYPESDFEPLPTGYVVTVIAAVAFMANMLVVFLTARGRD